MSSRVRAIVITGTGSAFCSGGDIRSMERMPPEQAIELIRPAQRLIQIIWSTGKPVLAAVEGAAIGGGTALADAERFAVGPARAYAAIKALLGAAPTLSRSEVLDREANVQVRLFDTDDFAEGIAALRAGQRSGG